MHRYRLMLAAFIVAGVTTASASAAMIDDFSGAFPTTIIQVTDNPFLMPGPTYDIKVSNGFFDFSVDAAVTVTAKSRYFGLGQDPSLTTLLLDFPFLGKPFYIEVEANGTALPVEWISTTGVAAIDLSPALGGAGLDDLDILFNASPRVASLDFLLDDIQLVPEPASLVLAAAACVLLAGSRRRRV